MKIVFIALDAIGHVSAGIGMAEVLIASGHRVFFVVNEQWRGRLTKYGIEEVLLTYEERRPDQEPAERWTELLAGVGAISSGTPFDNSVSVRTEFVDYLAEEVKHMDPKVDQLLKDIKPDVILLDHLIGVPSVMLSGIPWVLICSFNPLMFIDDKGTPPWGSGLATEGMRDECDKYKERMYQVTLPTWHKWNKYILSRGLPPLESGKLLPDSPYLNIYGFPLELDYLNVRPLPPKWYRFDNLKRTDKHSDFQIPDQLRGKPGKLIYFSLGSMGGAEVELMKRLINILSKSEHKYIVSKGIRHDQFDLPDNMWGQKFVPQIQVLSLVDLVITHGGNNTVTETFFFGKPMIVMPFFADQLDNAQRIHEKGFGIRLDPYRCSEEQLLNAIESLLNDKQLNDKLKNISKRIQTENSIEKLHKLLENLVIDQDNRKPG